MVLILLRTNNACFAAKELIKTSLAVQNVNNVRVDIQLYRKLPPLKTIAEVTCLPLIHLQLIGVNVSIAQTYQFRKKIQCSREYPRVLGTQKRPSKTRYMLTKKTWLRYSPGRAPSKFETHFTTEDLFSKEAIKPQNKIQEMSRGIIQKCTRTNT